MTTPFAMIDTSYSPLPMAATEAQLEGPWSVARGLEPELPTKARAVIILASAALSAFHGAKRNGGSIFWGVTWFGLGALFPVVTPVIGLAQGFGECRNNCATGKTYHLSGSGENDRFNDLQRQGFMKFKKPRTKKTAPPMVACDWCSNWHPKGKHTRPGRPPRSNKQRVI